MTPYDQRTLSSRIANLLISYPKTSILLGLLLFALAAPGVRYLQSDFTYRIWFQKDDPLLEAFDRFERRFGNDETVAVVIHSESGIFDRETIEVIRQITHDMWRVPEIIRVDSLTNYNWTHAEVETYPDGSVEEELLVDPLIPDPDEAELTDELLAERRAIALNHEVIPGYLISEDGQTAVVFARLKPAIGGSPNFKAVIDGARKVIQRHDNGVDHEFYLTGNAAVTNTFREVTESDLKTVVPLLLGAIVLFLLIFFRRLSGIGLPFIVIIMSVVSTLGLSGWLGIKINNLTSIVPHILIAIAIADAVHILVTYFQHRRSGAGRREGAHYTLTKNLQPTLLTSVSTSIGFFSFTSAEIVPIMHLGVLAGIGTLVAWVVTILVIGPLLAIMPIKVKPRSQAKSESFQAHPLAERYADWLQKRRRAVIAVFSVVTAVALVIALQNVVNSDPFKYFAPSVPTRIANEFIEDELGGSMGLEINIDSGQENGIYQPQFLKKVEAFQAWIDDLPYVTKTIAITDIVKQINRSLHNEDPSTYVIPNDRETIAQEIFLYTMSLPQGMDLNDRMSLNQDMLRLTAMWTLHESRTSLKEMKRIEAKAAELGLNAYVTGKTPLWHGLNPHVVRTFLVSISLAVGLVSLLLILVFRSVKLGLLAMIPNGVPLIFGGALMTLIGKPLDIGTVIVASVCLGIAVDDTIHFLANYSRWHRLGESSSHSVAQVVTHTGPALFVTTMILVAAFGTFAFASFVPNINFGIMTAIILMSALITDFTLLPALLLKPQAQEAERAAVDLEAKVA